MKENMEPIEEQLIVENVDNEILLKVVLEDLKYDMIKDILIKPLEPIKIIIKTNSPVETDEIDPETDKPVMAMEMQEIEALSSFRTGIVLALPKTGAEFLTIGQKVAYPNKYSIDFDLFKDSVLVKPYDIIATVK